MFVAIFFVRENAVDFSGKCLSVWRRWLIVGLDVVACAVRIGDAKMAAAIKAVKMRKICAFIC